MLATGVHGLDASAALAQLSDAVMVRAAPSGEIYGRDEIDPLLWRDSIHLSTGESRETLIAAADAVLKLSADEVQQSPPTQRALVQNRAWAAFDHLWQRRPNDRDLQQRLAAVIAKLALDEAEIAGIADPITEAIRATRWPTEPKFEGGPDCFLPADLLNENGAWRELVRSDGKATAQHHLDSFGGRSAFAVLIRFPDDNETPEAYFQTLAETPLPYVVAAPDSNQLRLNPSLPVLPPGTQLALVRRLAVVDGAGRWRATSLTLSVQLRRYRLTDPTSPDYRTELREHDGRRLQQFSEFVLLADAVAKGNPPRLRPLAADERGFLHLFAHHFDQIDGSGAPTPEYPSGPRHVPLQTCHNCHSGPGLSSLNSLMFMTPPPALLQLRAVRPGQEPGKDAQYKITRADWGALQALSPLR